jgi:hypothetical protein
MRPIVACVLVGLAACGGGPEPEQAPREAPRSVSGSLDPELPYGSELSISASAPVTDALRGRIEAQLRTALAQAMPCMDGIYGTAWVDVELDAKGGVTTAALRREGLLAGTPIATCIETALKTMKIGAVDGAPVHLGYPVRNMPSAAQIKEAGEIVKQAM